MSRHAFTLLELILVIVVIGAVATLIFSGVTRSSAGLERKTAVQAIHSALLHARADAMQTATQTRVRVEFQPSWKVSIVRDHASEQIFVAPGLARHILHTPAGPRSLPDPFAPLVASFTPAGRTNQLEWAFGLEDSADTLWMIRFDPLSGAPRLIEGGVIDPAAEAVVQFPSTERRP